MKKTFLFLLAVIYCVNSYAILKDQEPLLVVTLMVKDEEAVMEDTLKPFLEAGVDAYVILDTGSTDKTIEITQQLFDTYGVHNGHIIEQPFINFAASRNAAIEAVENLFSQSIFILMIDAEWHMHNVEGLLQFCKDHINDSTISFLTRLLYGKDVFLHQRLFKAHQGIRFCGAVHECLNVASTVKLPEDIYLVWHRTQYGFEKSKQRWLRDKDILLAEYKKNNKDGRTLFYLGQTCNCLGDYKESLFWYKKRLDCPGWPEEDFITCYRIAQIYEQLADWDQALSYYIKAYGMRPTRVEPLVKLAQHYWRSGQYQLSFLFALRACMLPYPNDILFVEKVTYDHTRYEVLGIVAWYVQEYEIGKNAALKALEYAPDSSQHKRNVQFYLDREHS